MAGSGEVGYGADMSTEHQSVTRFREELTRRGGQGEVRVLPETVHTAALAAQALGCEVGAIANSLLFDADGAPVLVLTSGAHRVNTDLVAQRIGVSSLRRATPEFVREHTGFAPSHTFQQRLEQTAAWYIQQGWLRVRKAEAN